LLRPAALLRARTEHAAGRISDASLRVADDEAIAGVVAREVEIGLPLLSDGEFRRGSWITEMAAAVDGFVPQSRVVEWRGVGGGPEESTSQIVGGKLIPWRRIAGVEADFLATCAGGAPFKITLPAPSNFYVMGWRSGVSDAAYEDRAAMMADVVAIVRSEVEALLASGVKYIQLDAPYYGVFIDDDQRDRLRGAGTDPDSAMLEAIAFDRATVAGLRGDDTTLALHICRGNSKGRWFAEGGYDPLAEALFGSLDVDRFLLEYDSDLAGGFTPLRYLPGDKIAVLGLVTTKHARIEAPAELVSRLDAASSVVPLEQLGLSPQCGFASVAAGNPLGEDDQWRKLELVVEVAHQVWE
jgi:5-methyltetrahydropteroyltriglutamate--homocysteine methyltransferase